MVWLGEEVEHRSEVIDRAINSQGRILADVGPELIVICEELNLAADRRGMGEIRRCIVRLSAVVAGLFGDDQVHPQPRVIVGGGRARHARPCGRHLRLVD